MNSFQGSGVVYSRFGQSDKNINIDIKQFFYDSKYIFLFYVIGDIITTVFAIENKLGYEGNIVMAWFIEMYGFGIIAVIKLLFMFLLFLQYIYFVNIGQHRVWNMTILVISLMGVLIVTNNILVIAGLGSPMQFLLLAIGII